VISQYIVKEASEDAFVAYKNVTMRALSFQGSSDGEKGMKGAITGGC